MKRHLILTITLFMCMAFLIPVLGLGTAAMAQSSVGGKRLSPAQQRIVKYQKEQARKADSVAAAKSAALQSNSKGAIPNNRIAAMQAMAKAKASYTSELPKKTDAGYVDEEEEEGYWYVPIPWEEVDEWERESYTWTTDSMKKAQYKDILSCMEDNRKQIYNILELVGIYGDTHDGSIDDMLPFFEGDSTLQSSQIALPIIRKYRQWWEKDKKELEEAYAKDEYNGEFAYNFNNKVYNLTGKLLYALREKQRDLVMAYQQEYANKYYGSVVSFQMDNCTHMDYTENFKGSNVSKENPSTVVLNMYGKTGYDMLYAPTSHKVNGYYMVPSDTPSKNPKSWYVLGCLPDTMGEELNATEQPTGNNDPNFEGYNWTEPTDDQYEVKTAGKKRHNWIVISHVTDADLSKMEKDGQGRILFPAQKPGEFMYVMLYVTDVKGGNDNPNKNMELKNFYTNDDYSFSFTPEKTRFTLKEWPRVIKLGTEKLHESGEDYSIAGNSVIVDLVHDNGMHSISKNIELNSNNEITIDLSEFHCDEAHNESFPLKLGKLATAYIYYTLENNKTGEQASYRQAVPIYMSPGKPDVLPSGPKSFDSKENGSDKIDYTFTIENIDPLNGAFIHIDVNDYSSGKLANNMTEFTLLPEDMDFDNLDKEYGGVKQITSWLKIERGDRATTDYEALGTKLTAKAIITLPVTCIPFATATVSAGAANLTIEDPYGEDAFENYMGDNPIYNTSYDPSLIRGTWHGYTGSNKEPRDIDDWDETDNGIGERLASEMRSNIENSIVIDSLLNEEAYRFSRKLDIEYPIAWGEPAGLFVNGNDTIRSWDGGWSAIPKTRCSFVVDFPSNGKTSTLTLSWMDGKITREFRFTGSDAKRPTIYCFAPVVHGDNSDKLHNVTILGRYDLLRQYSYNAYGHFSDKTTHKDNKVYIIPDGNFSNIYHSDFSCRLNSNGFLAGKRGKTNKPFECNPSVGIIREPGIYSEPQVKLLDSPQYFDLRENARYARIAVYTESGEPLNYCDVRYNYTKERVGQSGRHMGHDKTAKPLFVYDQTRQDVLHADADNVYSVPLLISDDPDVKYNLMVEIVPRKGWNYNSRLLCEAIDGDAFTRAVETNDIYNCVLEKKSYTNRNMSPYFPMNVYTRGKDFYAFSDSITRINPRVTRSLSYVGDGSNCIDILLRTDEGTYVNTYVLAPKYVDGDGRTLSMEGYQKAMDIALDEDGYPISWPASDTGFLYDYRLLTTNSQYLLPGRPKGQENPDGYPLTLWKGTRKLNDRGEMETSVLPARSYWDGEAVCSYVMEGYDYEEDHSAEIVGDAMDFINVQTENLSLDDKKGSLGFLGGLLDSFCSLDLDGPECLPFKLSLTHKDDHFSLRGQFSYNMLNAVPGYAAYQEAQKYGTSALEFQENYLKTKREFISESDMKAMKVAQGLNAFVGFKGFFECGLYHSDDFRTWNPYFNGLGVRFEASVSARTPELPIKLGSVGMSLNAAFYTQLAFMNPAKNDPLIGDTNYLSSFNFYYTMGASIDVAAWLEAGFDLGFIAASAGIRGAAGASMEFTMLNRLWYKKNAFYPGLRFNVNASLAAYAKLKFLLWEESWEHKFFDVKKTAYFPNSSRAEDGNPYLTDPNLEDGMPSASAKACVMRPAFSNYAKRYPSTPELKVAQVLSDIDAYSSPTFYGKDGKIAYFNLNNPGDVMDDRIVIKDGSGVTAADSDDCTALSFSASTAPGSDKSIMAIQRLKKGVTSVNASDMSDDNRKSVGNSTEILAINPQASEYYRARVISEEGSTNLAPKTAIDTDGNYAIVWPTGETKFEKTENGSQPFIKGNLMMYSQGKYNTYEPLSVAVMDSTVKINDYAVGISNGMPFVWATIPQVDKVTKKTVPCVYGIVNDNGFVNQMSLGIRGSNHNIIPLNNGHFIATSREVSDSAGVDVSLYEGYVENGRLNINKLGSLGLEKHNVTNYKVFPKKGGAQSADDLFVVWNQHDIDITDAQTLDATSANNCYAAQISTTNGLAVSYPTKLCTLNDEESLVNIDAYASDDREVTALLCVSGAGNNESNGAYVLQIDSKIGNKVTAVGAELNSIIVQGSATDIRVKVRNEGYEPITSLAVEMNSVKAKSDVTILPGDQGTISVKLPSSTDFTQAIDYTVNATFTNPTTKKTEVRNCGDAFKLEVADIGAELLYNQLDTASAKSIVLATVKNFTAGTLNESYTVKVGIYQDPNGYNIYPRTKVVDLTANEFKASGNNIVLPFRVPTQKEEKMVYLIAQTVTEDGIVVKDQDTENNIVPLNIQAYVKDTPTGVGEEEPHVLSAEDFEKSLLTVRNDGDGIIISNIDTDNDVKVYGTGGSLIHWTTAKDAANANGTLRIPRMPHGIILISNGTKAGKILH